MPLLTGSAILSGTYIKGMRLVNSVIQSSKLDMAYQTITSVADPQNPSDAATKYFVENTVASVIKVLDVHLQGNAWSQLCHLHPATYLITVSSTNGGPTASFMVSKNSRATEPHIARITSLPGEGSMEEIDLRWIASGPLQIRIAGSGHHYSGCYKVKII
jgi:hypothetical protein